MPLKPIPKLALSNFRNFDHTISRHLAFARRRLLKPAVGQATMTFPSRIAFIHSLPLMLVNRHITLFQKNEPTTQKNVHLTINNQPVTLNYQTQTFSPASATPSRPATAPESSIVKTSSLTSLNFFPKTALLTERSQLASPVSLVLSNGTPLQFQQKASTPKETELAAKTLSTPYPKTAVIPQPQKATVFQDSRRTLFAQSILVHSRRLHFFTEQLAVNRIIGIGKVANVEAPLTLRLPETVREKGKPQGIEGYESGAEEHFISNQSQIARNGMKQADDESAAPKKQQKMAEDLNVLADKIYQLIERKARIERERRG